MAWFERFHSVFLAFDFTYDYALFTHQTPHGFAILLLYVDDMVISGDDDDTIFMRQQQFQKKDHGNLCYFLGL